ncbi:hypothetical protein [Alteromonas halophila]|uniref:Uncharacterized protein n=1 Tax=Alteromonas halophila TaxID=516698 RepID=A0A918JDK0_9ALTE|nr:hypothetical protein [Alteromonas halophila]GGW73585.1 hypothetical protein GCM10007391_01590 [Alteromonas halophila]
MQQRPLHFKLLSHFTEVSEYASLWLQVTLSPSLHAVNPSMGLRCRIPAAEGIEMQQRRLHFKLLSHFTEVSEYASLWLQATLSPSLHAVNPSMGAPLPLPCGRGHRDAAPPPAC